MSLDNASLACVHVKFGVERAVQNLPIGEDITGGMWSPNASAARRELLYEQETQWSGFDKREVVIDERTSTSLSNFSNIFDLMQWRVARQPDELAYCTIDGRGKEGKHIPWKKFDTRVAAVAIYLKNKIKLKPGDHVVLMYTHSEDYVFAIYACMALGVIAIPVAPLDANRLSEDAPAYLHIVADMGVRAVLCNSDVNDLFKQKLVSQHLKQSAQYLRTHIPPVHNTTKPSKQSHGCRDHGLTVNKAWISQNNPVIIWTYWTPDQRRISVQLGHDTLLGMCKVQKETCQMTSSKPVLGCVRSTMGIGFLHTALMGVYNGSPTYLISPLDFAQNPITLFLTLSRYKIKDTYATSQMLDFAMSRMPGKGFSLHEVKNLMIATDSRPRQDLFGKVRTHFAQAGLERTAVNTIYSHVLNPMISSRSYMSIEPIELWLDTRALRRGLIYPVDPDSDPTALLVQDSGMVPVSTRISIVNPETCQLCHVGEYGEIWVQSEACAKSFYMSKQQFDEERFNGRIMGGDLNSVYVRTGDLGFLHNVTRPIGPGNQPVEMQILFVLGSIGETFEVNGLNHFPIDIENSVEKSHRNITPGGCAVFQAGGLVVVIVEVFRKAYLASIVPVIVNAVLNEHQIIVDIVAFVGQGDFPRSRLSEKQRGKILASWVTRKLRTIAQFGIRDTDASARPLSEAPPPRKSTSMTSKPVSQDQPRNSVASETPPQQGDLVSTRSSIMPELPLELPPNHYQLDPTGMFEDATPTQDNAPVLKVNSRPVDPAEGVAEMPTEANEYSPYITDEKFFDPEQPFGDSAEDLNEAAPGGPPRLSIVNPGDYSPDNSTENTPTSYTATATPTSAIPLSDSRANSPYGDAGNPFRESIPAAVPSFDFVGPQAGQVPRSAVNDTLSPVSPPSAGPVKGRGLLPSQQARYGGYHGQVTDPSGGYENYEDRFMPKEFRDETQYGYDGRQPMAESQGRLGSRGNDGLQPHDGRQSVDLSSVSGSVRHRYDGSGYDGYEY